MIDIHNHLHDHRLSPFLEPLIEKMKEAGITQCVSNGTSPDDWPILAKLAEKHPDFVIPAFGLHPWKVKKRPSDWLPQLKSFLADFPHAHIGECGLDRWIAEPDIDAQKAVFMTHLELAHELRRPLSIHCLKAWGALLECLAEIPLPPHALLHSYSGSLEFAQQLRQKHDPWFSFSGYFLQARKKDQCAVFSQLPSDRILMETDAPDMLPPPEAISHPLPDELNHPANLPLIAENFLANCGEKINLAKLNDNSDCFLKQP